jgi:alcohol dehydrogenase (cytochrome c)
MCVDVHVAGQTAATDWPSYNRTPTSERYAPLDQIDRTNVSKLKSQCVFDLNVDTNFQTGPIVIGGTLYATTDKDLIALDAATCQQKWRVGEEGPSVGLAVNRGAAYLDGRLFRGTSDGGVTAYDAQTGKKIWTTRIADREKGESVPSAPLAWNGLLFVGTAGSDVYGGEGAHVRARGRDWQGGVGNLYRADRCAAAWQRENAGPGEDDVGQ